jgi:hypothetical protein
MEGTSVREAGIRRTQSVPNSLERQRVNPVENVEYLELRRSDLLDLLINRRGDQKHIQGTEQ